MIVKYLAIWNKRSLRGLARGFSIHARLSGLPDGVTGRPFNRSHGAPPIATLPPAGTAHHQSCSTTASGMPQRGFAGHFLNLSNVYHSVDALRKVRWRRWAKRPRRTESKPVRPGMATAWSRYFLPSPDMMVGCPSQRQPCGMPLGNQIGVPPFAVAESGPPVGNHRRATAAHCRALRSAWTCRPSHRASERLDLDEFAWPCAVHFRGDGDPQVDLAAQVRAPISPWT